MSSVPFPDLLALDAREVRLGEYQNASALTNGEVAATISRVIEEREAAGERIDPMLVRCRDHCNKFNKILVPQTEIGAREFMKEKGLYEFEIAVLINNCPESVQAAREMQPSLRRLIKSNDSDLEDIISALRLAHHNALAS